MIAILLTIASFEAGYILGKWQDFDRDGKLAKHETKIKILESEILKGRRWKLMKTREEIMGEFNAILDAIGINPFQSIYVEFYDKMVLIHKDSIITEDE